MSWQDFRVTRERTLTDRVRPAATWLRRRPAQVIAAALVVGSGVLAVVSNTPTVTERCAALGEECPRFEGPAVAGRATMTSSCFAPFRAEGQLSEVSVGEVATVAPEPVYVTAYSRADDPSGSEIARATTTPLGGPEVRTPPVRGDADAPQISLGTGATWFWPDLPSLDAWLDERDLDVLDERRSRADVSMWDGVLAVRTDAPEPQRRPADIEVRVAPVTDEGLVRGGLDRAAGADRPAPGPKEELLREAYPRVDVGPSQVITTDLRGEAQREVRTTTFYSVPGAPETTARFGGVGMLTVVSRADESGRPRVTGVELVHARNRPAKAVARTLGTVVEGRTLTELLTLRVAVDATNRDRLLGWLADVEEQRVDGQLPLPPNILDPSLPVPRDPVQNTLYRDATVVIELHASQALRGEAAVIAWAGVDDVDPRVERVELASQLLDRSPDGVRRAFRPLTCRSPR